MSAWINTDGVNASSSAESPLSSVPDDTHPGRGGCAKFRLINGGQRFGECVATATTAGTVPEGRDTANAVEVEQGLNAWDERVEVVGLHLAGRGCLVVSLEESPEEVDAHVVLSDKLLGGEAHALDVIHADATATTGTTTAYAVAYHSLYSFSAQFHISKNVKVATSSR